MRRGKRGRTHVLVDVEERSHGGSGDGVQVRLVPVHAERASCVPAALVVTRHVLQKKGLLLSTAHTQIHRR